MRGLVTSRDYEGMPLEEASEKAKNKGLDPRVVEVDGRSIMLNVELKSHRVNFRVRDGIVIEAWAG